MLMFKWLAGMQQSGNIDVYKSAVGCQGKVYLTIPGERKGTGKVQIVINESVREYDAVTDCDTITTGAQIEGGGSDRFQYLARGTAGISDYLITPNTL